VHTLGAEMMTDDPPRRRRDYRIVVLGAGTLIFSSLIFKFQRRGRGSFLGCSRAHHKFTASC
jgi:hypothetical protein